MAKSAKPLRVAACSEQSGTIYQGPSNAEAKSLKATIEHGHANVRSDNYFSVAYWYQTEPHAAFPALPPVEDRLPKIHAVGGPGNAPN